MDIKLTFTFVIFGLALIAGFTVLTNNNNNSIDSFAECVQAGGAIAESYPEQCFPPNGGPSFVNPSQQL